MFRDAGFDTKGARIGFLNGRWTRRGRPIDGGWSFRPFKGQGVDVETVPYATRPEWAGKLLDTPSPVQSNPSRDYAEGETKTIARWESRSGKHYVDLWRGRWGPSYDSPGASGSMGNITDAQAIAEIERKLSWGMFQPDKAKTPMRRVV